MLFSEYDTWFWEETNRITLESDCKSCGPFVTATVSPNRPPWKAEWTVLFRDGLYFRAVENWYRRKAALGGKGYREAFSFHYGPSNPDVDGDGVPLPSPQYPAIIRIDQDDRSGPHLHYGGEDHIPQSRVLNLRISDAEFFEFIRAVQRHRTTSKGFMRFLDSR